MTAAPVVHCSLSVSSVKSGCLMCIIFGIETSFFLQNSKTSSLVSRDAPFVMRRYILTEAYDSTFTFCLAVDYQLDSEIHSISRTSIGDVHTKGVGLYVVLLHQNVNGSGLEA
ncbi:hypothetical protein ElyMa_006738100 [Elysia marginata]|uniref:Uncharacterized protein n=1 Tax=Elysia marginata TaxID=1093978 RepID=A0AAV4IWZ5_9GAST|nr:hypothetical protein ElyMa_006738100 [Elysia marginata]